MSDERLTDSEIAEIEGRQKATTGANANGSPTYWQALRIWQENAPTDIDALLAEVKALKAELAEARQPRESMLEQAARILRGVNEAAGQEGD